MRPFTFITKDGSSLVFKSCFAAQSQKKVSIDISQRMTKIERWNSIHRKTVYLPSTSCDKRAKDGKPAFSSSFSGRLVWPLLHSPYVVVVLTYSEVVWNAHQSPRYSKLQYTRRKRRTYGWERIVLLRPYHYVPFAIFPKRLLLEQFNTTSMFCNLLLTWMFLAQRVALSGWRSLGTTVCKTCSG